jgi:hypothetical protein
MSAPAPAPSPEVENAVFQWEDGYRKLQAARSQPDAYRALSRAVEAVQQELRKRLGSKFSVSELASLYRQGTDWSLDVALGSAPADAPAVDAGTAADAAFYLYMREATDFAGGRART